MFVLNWILISLFTQKIKRNTQDSYSQSKFLCHGISCFGDDIHTNTKLVSIVSEDICIDAIWARSFVFECISLSFMAINKHSGGITKGGLQGARKAGTTYNAEDPIVAD